MQLVLIDVYVESNSTVHLYINVNFILVGFRIIRILFLQMRVCMHLVNSKLMTSMVLGLSSLATNIATIIDNWKVKKKT